MARDFRARGAEAEAHKAPRRNQFIAADVVFIVLGLNFGNGRGITPLLPVLVLAGVCLLLAGLVSMAQRL